MKDSFASLLLRSGLIFNCFVISLIVAFAAPPARAESPIFSQCNRQVYSPWLRELPRYSEILAEESCPSFDGAWKKFTEVAKAQCERTYIGSRMDPLKKVADGEQDGEWSLFSSLYRWPGAMDVTSLRRDFDFKMSHCISTALTETLPLPKPQRMFYGDAMRVGFHALSLYLAGKSMMIAGPLTPWHGVRKLSYTTSLKKRQSDMKRFMSRMDMLYTNEVRAEQQQTLVAVGDCELENAREHLRKIKKLQQQQLLDSMFLLAFAQKAESCGYVRQSAFNAAYVRAVVGANHMVMDNICHNAFDLRETWQAWNEVVPVMQKERGTLTAKFAKQRQSYVEALGECNFERADTLRAEIYQLKSSRCASQLPIDELEQAALSGYLADDIEEVRAEKLATQGGARASCTFGTLRHFGVGAYYSAYQGFILFTLLGVVLVARKSYAGQFLPNFSIAELLNHYREARTNVEQASDAHHRHLTPKLMKELSGPDPDRAPLWRMIVFEGIEWSIYFMILVSLYMLIGGAISAVFSNIDSYFEQLITWLTSLK